MRFEARLLTLGLLALAVSGCGQKGPLFLPDKTGEVVTRPGPGPATPESPPASSSAPSPADLPAQPPQTPDSKKKDPPPK